MEYLEGKVECGPEDVYDAARVWLANILDEETIVGCFFDCGADIVRRTRGWGIRCFDAGRP